MTPEQERKLGQVAEGLAALNASVQALKDSCDEHFRSDDRQIQDLVRERRKTVDRLARLETASTINRRWAMAAGPAGAALLEGLRHLFATTVK